MSRKTRVTIQDEFDFVKLMIERDLANHRSDRERLDYLMLIGTYIDDVGEQILCAKSPTTVGTDIKFEVGKRLGEARHSRADFIGPGSRLGEDRPEFDESDIELGGISDILKRAFPEATIIDMTERPNGLSLLADIFEATRPDDYEGLNPVEFMATGECLKGAEAHEWLYRRKIPHSYDHIHVFKHDLVLALPDKDDIAEDHRVTWLRPDGTAERGSLGETLRHMFWAYMDLEKENSDVS